MSRITEIIADLRENSAAIERLEGNIGKNPDAKGLTITMGSLLKRRSVLEGQFEEVTNRDFVDIVNYRIIPEDMERLPLRAVTGALDRFQAAVSTIFDALKTGPKKRTRLSADVLAQTGFDFGYTYAGSLGVVLSIPNERLLLGESDLDVAVEMFFAATKTKSREEIVQFAERAGIPSVRRLYEWSIAHSNYGLSAAIEWRRKDDIRRQFEVEPAALATLQQVIEETSEVDEESVETTGVLVGLDTTLKTFHLLVPDAEDIKGSWSEDYSYSPEHVLNVRYVVKMTKKSVVYYAYEREEVSWSLISLGPVKIQIE